MIAIILKAVKNIWSIYVYFIGFDLINLLTHIR